MKEISEYIAAGELFFRIHEKLMTKIAQEYDLNRTEVKTLIFLHLHPAQNTAKQIVEHWQIPKSCVSKAIDTLTRKGYVVVREDAEDRRVLHLFLQEKAEPLLRRVEKEQEEMMEALASGMTDTEKERMRELGEKMSACIHEMAGSGI